MSRSGPPAVSVVIPCFNYAHVLPRALHSVAAQQTADLEVIVVDDGSTDGTPDLVRCHEGWGVPLRCVSQPNRGSAAARNRGIREAKGSAIMFLDADDELLPGALCSLTAALSHHRGAGFAAGGYEIVEATGRKRRRPAAKLSPSPHRTFRRYIKKRLGLIPTSGTLIRRHVFDRLSFPETLRTMEDVVFKGHLVAQFRGVAVDPSVIRIHRHEDSLSHQLAWVKIDRIAAVDALFDPAILPQDLMPLRIKFEAMIRLALFRDLYRDGAYADAEVVYRELIARRPALLLHVRYAKKYARVLLRRLTGTSRWPERSPRRTGRA